MPNLPQAYLFLDLVLAIKLAALRRGGVNQIGSGLVGCGGSQATKESFSVPIAAGRVALESRKLLHALLVHNTSRQAGVS